MRQIAEQAPAKVNLDLRITGRRPDGYHELDSLVVFTGWADQLTFTRHRRLTLELSGPFATALDDPAGNLVLRAARRLAEHAGCLPHVRIALDKRIPVAAGLGGGSADAAATLRGLSRLWQLELRDADLLPLALELGADVPVCLRSGPARMRGIGERLEPIELPVSNSSWPTRTTPFRPRRCSRASARSHRQPARRARADGRADLLAWLRARGNDLEAPARRIAPVIGEVLATLGAQPGCRLARMSGSGATCFGVFDDEQAAARAARAMRQVRPSWWVISTATRPA